jgi:arabinose-5-phosphate isomerase
VPAEHDRLSRPPNLGGPINALTDDALQRGVDAALAAMSIESDSIARTREEVRTSLPRAVELLSAVSGRVLVSGLGKSGHIGAKMAATLASTGTPAQFVHAGEALHGDSGVATSGDAAILISYSGETVEVCQFAQMLRAVGVPMIALTGRADSTLALGADVHLSIAVTREADPLNLAPTASTASTLALGDALAAALMAISGFSPEDFWLRHPGGSLGKQLAGSAEAGLA